MKRYGESRQGDQVKCSECGKRKAIDLSEAARGGGFPECHGQVMEMVEEGDEEQAAPKRRPSRGDEDEDAAEDE